MKRILKLLLAVAFVFALTSSMNISNGMFGVSTAKADNIVLNVIGNDNCYPIEYYDTKTQKYKGIIPDYFEIISQKTNIEFKYIDAKASLNDNVIDNFQTQIVTYYDIDNAKKYINDSITILTFNKDGKEIKCGFGFTKYADLGVIDALKKASDDLSESDMQSIIINQMPNNRMGDILKCIAVISIFALLLIIVFLMFKNKSMNIKIQKNKMVDSETGLGNLAYLREQFEKIPYLSIDLYYMTYLIFDSNYIRSRYDKNTFSSIVKHGVSVIEDSIDKTEIVARVTESGFVLAIHEKDLHKARKRIEHIVEKINTYLEIDTDSDKTLVHAAMYNLCRDEKDLDFILSNLRINCNNTILSNQKIVVCDELMMNKVLQEEKKYQELRNAIESGEFEAYIQFVVNNKTKKIFGAEMLSRWNNPKRGLIYPAQYIDILEKNGLIAKLDFYMFDKACELLQKWKGTEYEEIRLSCNLTRITISKEYFIEKINRIANNYSIDKSKLIIEITEDSLENNHEFAKKNIEECKKMGYTISLDDLGSGYTSLSNLSDYPIDFVKIDRDILQKCNESKGKALFEGIVSLSHKIKMLVVCEGVETSEQNEFVENSKCDYIQGYYYHKPIPAEKTIIDDLSEYQEIIKNN